MSSHGRLTALGAGMIAAALTVAGMHAAVAQKDPFGNLDLDALKQELQKSPAPQDPTAKGGPSANPIVMSEREARTKAIAFLKGDPYGETNAEVAGNIKDARLSRQGPVKACRGIRTPSWEFHIVVVTPRKDQFNNGVIDGYLALDAASGKLVCANLPQLD